MFTAPLAPSRSRLASRRPRRRRFGLAFVLLAAALTGAAGSTPLADPAVLPGTLVDGNADGHGRDVAVAPNGDVVLVGHTSATDLPVTDASINAGGNDLFVARFDGRFRTLEWLVYLGGSGEDLVAAVAIDGDGDVYVTGSTDSTDFPTTSAYDVSANGYGDVFLAKLAAADGSLVYSTYLGGTFGDEARDLTVDEAGRAIIVGQTVSSDFPTASAFDTPHYNGDAFITRFAANGASLELSTYWSTAMGDNGVAVGVDGSDDIYVGIASFDVEQAYQENRVLKIDATSKTVSWSFQIDSLSPSFSGIAALADIAVSSGGVVAFAGTIDDTQTSIPMIDPLQAANAGGKDFFVGKLNGAGNAITWSSYLGGHSDEDTVSLAMTGEGDVWLAGYSSSADYPLEKSLFPAGFGVVSRISADGQELLESTFVGGAGYPELEGIAWDGGAPVLAGSIVEAAELPLTGLLEAPVVPFSFHLDAFVARLAPVASGVSCRAARSACRRSIG